MVAPAPSPAVVVVAVATGFPTFATPSAAAAGPSKSSDNSSLITAGDDADADDAGGNENENENAIRVKRAQCAKGFADHMFQLPPRVLDQVAINRFLCTYQELGRPPKSERVYAFSKKKAPQPDVASLTDTDATATATGDTMTDDATANPFSTAAVPDSQPLAPTFAPPVATAPPPLFGSNLFGGGPPVVPTNTNAAAPFTGFTFSPTPSATPVPAPVAFSFSPAPPAATMTSGYAAAPGGSNGIITNSNNNDDDDDAAVGAAADGEDGRKDADDDPSFLPGGESADAAEWNIQHTVRAKVYNKKNVAICTSDLILQRRIDNPNVCRMVMREPTILKVVLNLMIVKGMPFQKTDPTMDAKKKNVSIRFMGVNGDGSSNPQPELFTLMVKPEDGDKLYSELIAMSS